MIFKNLNSKVVLQLFHSKNQTATRDLRGLRNLRLNDVYILEIDNIKNFFYSIYLLLFESKDCEVEIFKSFGFKAFAILLISRIHKVKVILDISNIPIKPLFNYSNIYQILRFYMSIVLIKNCNQITVPTIELKTFLLTTRKLNFSNIKVIEDLCLPYWLEKKNRTNFYYRNEQKEKSSLINVMWFGKTGSNYEKSGIFELLENIEDLKICSERYPNIKLNILIDFDGIKTIKILNEIISELPRLKIEVIKWSWELQKDLVLDSDIIYLPCYPSIFNYCRSSGKLAFASNFNENVICGYRPSYIRYINKNKSKNITNSSLNEWLENNIHLFDKE